MKTHLFLVAIAAFFLIIVSPVAGAYLQAEDQAVTWQTDLVETQIFVSGVAADQVTGVGFTVEFDPEVIIPLTIEGAYSCQPAAGRIKLAHVTAPMNPVTKITWQIQAEGPFETQIRLTSGEWSDLGYMPHDLTGGEILLTRIEMGDLTGDGAVTVADLIEAIRLWYFDEYDARADYNGDGEIGIGDIALMVGVI